MKKFIVTILLMHIIYDITAQVNNIHLAPPTTSISGWSTARGPNGTTNHTTMRAMYYVPASEMAAISSQSINTFGFQMNAGATGGVGASGQFSVYLMHTSDINYQLGTTWNTSGATNVYAGTLALPAVSTPTNVDVVFPSSFTFTGGAIYVFYEYIGNTFATSAATYACISSTQIQGSTNSTTAPPPSATTGTSTFRPQFRFGVPNPNSNDIAVNYIITPGFIPANTFTANAVQAKVTNASNTTHTNIAVNYTVSGVNNGTMSATIPTLSAGESTFVTFSPYTIPINASGLDSYTVAVDNDQVNGNNIATKTTSYNCDMWSAGPAMSTWTYGVGFGTGSGIIYSKFNLPVTTTLYAGSIAISSLTANGGNTVYAVLANAAGSVIATSNSVFIVPSYYGTYTTFNFTPTVLNPGVDYHIGLAQTPNTSGYYPLASFQATTIPPGLYATSSLTNNAVTPMTQNLGFLGIRAVVQGSAGNCSSVDLINNVLFESEAFVFPNPTINGKVNVGGLEGSGTIEVYNILGEKISLQKFENETVQIDLSERSGGTYIIKINGTGTKPRVFKIINQ